MSADEYVVFMTYGEQVLTSGANTVAAIASAFEERPGLNYLRAPISVRAINHPDGTRYDMSLDHPHLDANGLHAFTNAVAPHPNEDSKNGIVSDWNIVDRANEGSAAAQHLVNIHTYLGKAWQEFSLSRPAFLRVMSDGLDYSAFLHFDAHTHDEFFKRAEDIPTHRLVTDAAIALGGEQAVLDEVLRITGVEDPKAFILDAMSQALNGTRNARRQLMNEQRIMDSFNNRSAASRARLVELMTVKWSKEYRQVFDRVVRNAIYQQIETGDGVGYYVRRDDLDCDLAEQVANARVERNGRYEARVAELKFSSHNYYYHRYEERTRRVVVPGSFKILEPVSTIEPKLAWVKRSDGSRHFLIEREQSQDETGVPIFHDGVLGVMLAAYLSPEVRAEWPVRMGVRGAQREQALGAAQVPVLALFPHVQKRLLEADFIRNAEMLAS
jgi:hypothetical protein